MQLDIRRCIGVDLLWDPHQEDAWHLLYQHGPHLQHRADEDEGNGGDDDNDDVDHDYEDNEDDDDVDHDDKDNDGDEQASPKWAFCGCLACGNAG